MQGKRKDQPEAATELHNVRCGVCMLSASVEQLCAVKFQPEFTKRLIPVTDHSKLTAV
jgi:hypothetical protein